MPTSQHSEPRPLKDKGLARILAIAFAALLALAATLFYGGDLGRWNDDYYFLRNFDRSAAGGDPSAPLRVRSWVLDEPLHFWRPLYRYVYTPVIVALYHTPQALHILSACCHMAICAALWWFLRLLGIGRTPASIAALLFLVYPAHFEGALWVPCTPTPFATGLMLLALWLQTVWVRQVASPQRPPRLRSLSLLLAPAALTFAACCLNEQPAFIAAAMPAAIWCAQAAKQGRAPDRERTTKMQWALMLLPAFLAVLALLTYAGIAMRLFPQETGTTAGFVETDKLLHRLWQLARDVLIRIDLRRFGGGAWREGRHALREDPALSIATVTLLIITGIGWAWNAWSEKFEKPDHSGPEGLKREPRNTQGASVALLGLAIFIVCWGPLVIIHYPARPRLAYAPDAGLAMIIAGVLEFAFVQVLRRPVWKVVARVAVVPVFLVCAVFMIGLQHGYRARWQADERQGAAMGRLAPSLPLGTGPVFFPIRVVDRPVHTGVPSFDRYFLSPLCSPWAAGWWVQLHLRRTNVHCVLAVDHDVQDFGWIDRDHVRVGYGLVSPATQRISRFPIAQIVPFEIDETGTFSVYTHTALQDGESVGPARPLPMLAPAFESGLVPRRVLIISRSHSASASETAKPASSSPVQRPDSTSVAPR